MRTHLRRIRLALLPGLWLIAVSRPAGAQDTANDIASLPEQIEALDQKLRILEREREHAAADASAAVAAGAGGFSLTSPDRNYQLRIRGVVHADARFYLSDSGSDAFLLRRVRPSFEGTLAKDFTFRITPEFAGSGASLIDAYVAYQYSPAFNLQVGKFKVPFDLERIVSQTDLLFVERTYGSSLGPNRDNGIHVFGDLAGGLFSYNLAWVDGTADGGTSVTDGDDDKEIVGRVFTHPFKHADSPLKGLGFGVAVTTGDKSSGAPSGYRTNGQQAFFSWRGGVVSNGAHRRIEPQAYYYNGQFGLIGSWTSSKQDVTDGVNSGEIENTGWFVAASFVLTGEAASFKAVTPGRNFNLTEGSWGAWEVAVRFAELDIDDAAFPIFANPATSATKVSSTTLGLNWYINRNVKFVLNWEHSSFDGGLEGSVTGDDEDAILSRVQLRF